MKIRVSGPDRKKLKALCPRCRFKKKGDKTGFRCCCNELALAFVTGYRRARAAFEKPNQKKETFKEYMIRIKKLVESRPEWKRGGTKLIT